VKRYIYCLAIVICLALAACGPAQNEMARQIADYEPSDLAEMDAAVIAQYQQLKAQAVNELEGRATRQEKAQAVGRLGGWFYVFRINEAAIEMLEYAHELDARDATWPTLLGHLTKRKGDTELARYWWGRALDIDPMQMALKVRLAEMLMEESRFEEAEAALRELNVGRRGNSRVLYDLGKLAMTRDDAAEAVALLNRALVQQPGSGAILYQLGLAYRMLGDEQRARRHLGAGEKSAGDQQLPPMPNPALAMLSGFRQSARHLSDQASNLWDDGKQEEALRMIQRAVSAAPDRVIYRIRLASYMERMGRTVEAKRAVERVLRHESDNLRAMHGLGRAERRLGHRDEARVVLERLVERYPEDTRGLTELALNYNQAEEHDEALALLDQAVAQDPRAEMDRLWHIWTLVVLDRTEEAMTWAEEGVALLPDSYLLGGILLRLQIHCEPEPCESDSVVTRAEDLFRAKSNLYNAETLAMVRAREGDLEDAIRIQRAATRALARTRNEVLLGQARGRLADYESGDWHTIMWSRIDTMRPDLAVSVALRDRPSTD